MARKPVKAKDNPKKQPITQELRMQVYERDGKLCSGPGGCGLFVPLDELEIDHEIPKGMGGGNTDNRPENLWTKHRTCNQAKGSRRIENVRTAAPNAKIQDLAPDDLNANRGTERGGQLIEQSIKSFGLGRSILLDKNNMVIAGNKTLENAAAVGIENVVVVETTGDQLVAVQRVDLDMDEAPEMARALGIADNRTAEVNLEWDPEVLRELQAAAADVGPLFTKDELAQIFYERDQATPAGAGYIEPAEHEQQDLQAKWGTAPGQLWEIESKSVPGRAHCLFIGSSTQPEDLFELMEHGEQMIAVLAARVPDFLTAEAIERALTTWDLQMTAGTVVYLAHKDREGRRPAIEGAMGAASWKVAANIIAILPAKDDGDRHFGEQHQPILYGWKIGAEHYFCGDRTLTTVWKPETGDLAELFARMLTYSSRPGDTIGGPWAGYGAILLAAEHAARICYGMEKDPKQVAIALERLAGLGLQARRRA
jgi:5-methylcytosine-specific restriction endonuclease McrA